MEYSPAKSSPEEPNRLQQINGSDFGRFAAAELGRIGTAWVGDHSKFLSNGARMYPDVGDHFEYATPEDNSLMGHVANEIVGEQIIRGIADKYQEYAKASTYIHKRVSDENGTTAGYHANYLAHSKRIGTQGNQLAPDSLALYGVFAAIRGAVFGSGALFTKGIYLTSQKSVSCEDDFNNSTTMNKPVVNLRHEPLAGNEWRRIHDVSGDAHMSPFTTALKLGTGSLVLRLIENGRAMEHVRLAEPLHWVAQSVAMDTKLNEQFKLKRGSSKTALEILRCIVDEAAELNAENGLSNDEQWALEWLDSITFNMQRDPSQVADQVEWLKKLKILQAAHDKHGWSWQSPMLRAVDKQFTSLGEHSLGLKLRESNSFWAEHMPSPRLISARMKNAPAGTRAALRGRFVCAFANNNWAEPSANWNYVRANKTMVRLPHPYQTQSRDIDSLIGDEKQPRSSQAS